MVSWIDGMDNRKNYLQVVLYITEEGKAIGFYEY